MRETRQVSLKHLDVIHRWRSSFHSSPPSPGCKLYSRFYADAPASWLPLSVFTVKTTAAPRNLVALRYEGERDREIERGRVPGPGSRAFCFLPAMLNKPIWRSRCKSSRGRSLEEERREAATFLVSLRIHIDRRVFPSFWTNEPSLRLLRPRLARRWFRCLLPKATLETADVGP